jgi:lipopolysaccharide heptosyltransferase I
LRVLIAALRLLARLRSVLHHHDNEVSSILLVELSRLGDVISMLPAIRTIRKHFDTEDLHLLVDANYATLIESLNLDIRVHAVSRQTSFRGIFYSIKLARMVHADMAISMSPPKRNVVTVLSSGSWAKLGYLQYRNSLTPFLHATPLEAFGVEIKNHISYGRENIELRALKICEALDIESERASPRPMLQGAVVEQIRSTMKSRSLPPGKPYIVIHPFSGWEFREWGVDRFDVLAQRIVETTEYDVVITFSEDEKDRLLLDASLGDRVHLYLIPNVLELAVALEGASMFIGNDSGPLHLAAALGVRVVGLFGPAEPALTAPRITDDAFLYKRVQCSPCEQRKCMRPQNLCMRQISIDDVYQAVISHLSHPIKDVGVVHA